MRQGRSSGTAAVLFSDLVESTRLLSQLGEAAFDRVRRAHFQALRQAVERAGGEQVKTLGDGVLAVFGSAADAVACAVAMQQAVDGQARRAGVPLSIRVGLALGDVSFEEDDVFGTPVVQAARLVAVAHPGQILATALVRMVAGGRTGAAFSDKGLLELKGLPEPVAACEVSWERLAEPAVPLPALLTNVGHVFVGREAEMDRLGQLWKETLAGGSRLALLAGEPGIGKTRLAAELAKAAHAEGAVVLVGRCDEDLGVPYQPFVEALRHLVDHAPAEDLAGRLGRYAGELVRLVPEVADRVPGLPAALRSDPETERYRLFDATAAWLGAASADVPVLLVLDDLQWATKPTLLLLRHVVRSAEPTRLLVLGTYRDSELGHDHPLVELLADLRRHAGVERLSLAGLDASGVARFMEQAAGHPLTGEDLLLARAIYRETEGNPFFVREVLRHLTESGAVQRREGRWLARGPVEALGIPEGIRESVEKVSKAEGRGTFAELLRQHRLAAGLTQEALADRAGLSVRGIADLERGARRYPHFHTLRSLAQALELDPADRVALLAAGQRPAPPDPAGLVVAAERRCESCGRENTLDAGFCVECGQALAVPCPACGAPARSADRFCHACGASRTARLRDPAEAPDSSRAADSTVRPGRGAAPEGEHQQATVLYCQLADGAALARKLGTDGMLAFLDSLFEQAEAEVRRFEGTISSFLSDGLVALFGVPVAHEDHARRGVLAALGLQRRLAATPAGEDTRDSTSAGLLRMALNTGLVAVRQIGSGPERRLSAVGETTTVAGILQQQAEPGTILIGPATARMVTGYVRLEDLGPLQLPGTGGPVHAFRVTGTGPRRSPIEGLGARPLSRFVGREPEMRALRDVLDQVAVAPELSARPKLAEFIGRDHALAALRGPLAKVEAGHGQVVGIVGEPGIGKSRLLYEFRRSLADRPITYLEGRCLSFGGSIPYLPIVDVARANCGIAEADPPGVVIQKVRFGLQEVGLDADRHAPYVLHLLGLGEGSTALGQLSAEAVKSRMFETLRSWSLHGSRRRPLIIAIEDLHWVDRSSEEYLASLAGSLAGAPILLVCTWRPGYRPPWTEHSYVTQLGLRRLAPRDSLGLVSSVLGQDEVPGELVRVILERGEGNPFFLEELARAVLDGGAAESASFVPDTIQDVLMARIGRLDETPRQVLQTASVLGREVSLRLLAAVWPHPAALPAQLRTLQDLEFLYEQAGREPGFVFKHALTQDVAYATLLESRRRALHAAAGQALETLHADRLEEVYDRLAYHYARTDDAAKAVRYLTGFASRAAGMHAHSDAAHALEDALGHIARLPTGERDQRLVDTAVRLAASYYFLGRFRDTVELLERHRARMEQLGDSTLAGRFFFELAHAHSHLGDYQQAVACAERAIEAAQRAGDPSTRGKAHYVLSKESMWVARFSEGLEHGRRAASHLESTGERWWLGQSFCWQGINLYFMGDLNAALECAAGGFAIGEELGDHRLQSYAAWNRAWFSATRGDGQDAITWGHRSIDLSPDPLNNAFSLGWTGYAYLENGDAEDAIRLLERSIELLAGMRYSRLVGWFKGWLASAYLLAGDPARARTEAMAGLEISTGTGFTWAVGLAQRALGAIARAEGDSAGAAHYLTEALQTFETTQSRFDAARTHLELAKLADEHGPRADAAAHRRAARRLLTALGLATDATAARQPPARSATPSGQRNR